jgi:hypothetical protein
VVDCSIVGFGFRQSGKVPASPRVCIFIGVWCGPVCSPFRSSCSYTISGKRRGSKQSRHIGKKKKRWGVDIDTTGRLRDGGQSSGGKKVNFEVDGRKREYNLAVCVPSVRRGVRKHLNCVNRRVINP